MGLDSGRSRSRTPALATEMKVVYLTDQPFDERNYDRFGIQAWVDRNWTVEVWDLTAWANPRMWRDFMAYDRSPRRFGGYFAIASARELALRQRASGAVKYFVDLTGESYHSLRAKVPLARSGAARITCALGSIPIPEPTHSGSITGKLHKAIALGARGAFEALRDRVFSKAAAALAAPRLIVVAGSTSLTATPSERAIIQAHNFDYDIYLKLAGAADRSGDRYAVFIDQDYCFHPEFTCKESSTTITPGRYFPTVCNGLKAISAALEIQMCVAAHPRATYRQRAGNYFEEFRVEYGKTAELIRDCSVVVCHDSTAIQFAVLFGKPLIFVTTNELIPCYEGRSIAKVAAELGKSPVNLDGDLRVVDWRRQLHVDSRKYARYRARYIKTDGSPEVPVWDIVIDRVESTEQVRA
jgi:hypothetical protein